MDATSRRIVWSQFGAAIDMAGSASAPAWLTRIDIDHHLIY